MFKELISWIQSFPTHCIQILGEGLGEQRINLAIQNATGHLIEMKTGVKGEDAKNAGTNAADSPDSPDSDSAAGTNAGTNLLSSILLPALYW